MVDFVSKLVSIERCRELLGDEGSGLSDEAIETVRDQTDALAHLLIDIYLDQQRRERALGAVSSSRFDPGVVRKRKPFEINRLAGTCFE